MPHHERGATHCRSAWRANMGGHRSCCRCLNDIVYAQWQSMWLLICCLFALHECKSLPCYVCDFMCVSVGPSTYERIGVGASLCTPAAVVARLFVCCGGVFRPNSGGSAAAADAQHTIGLHYQPLLRPGKAQTSSTSGEDIL